MTNFLTLFSRKSLKSIDNIETPIFTVTIKIKNCGKRSEPGDNVIGFVIYFQYQQRSKEFDT